LDKISALGDSSKSITTSKLIAVFQELNINVNFKKVVLKICLKLSGWIIWLQRTRSYGYMSKNKTFIEKLAQK
jgi:hypothetical protein